VGRGNSDGGTSKGSGIVSKEPVLAIQAQRVIQWRGIHGLSHLARVWANGIHLAETTGAN